MGAVHEDASPSICFYLALAVNLTRIPAHPVMGLKPHVMSHTGAMAADIFLENATGESAVGEVGMKTGATPCSRYCDPELPDLPEDPKGVDLKATGQSSSSSYSRGP